MKNFYLFLFTFSFYCFSQTSNYVVTLRDTVIVPGKEYEAGGFNRFFLGDHWRDLWTTHIKVPVLDLQKTAGGLTPIKRGGGFQTKSLHFKGAEGKYYKFRSINKDPKKVLPKYLRNTFVADIVQDQISTSHPLSSIVVAPLLNAVGVLNTTPVVVSLPDDEALGEYRKDYGNVLGTFAENPKDDTKEALLFSGADKAVKLYKIFELCEKSNKNQVDAKEFLKARLMDIFLGDWDRHVGQWKWLRFQKDGQNIWKPVPRDRDQAFSLYDGIFPRIVARSVPQIESFDEDYPQINDLTWSGRFLDRRFLVSLKKAEWDSITSFVQHRLTDKVIEGAVKRMPAEWYAKGGTYIIETLKQRRDQLPDISEDFYQMIFKYVSIYASNKDEFARITRLNDDRVKVEIYNKNKASGKKTGLPFFSRTFDGDETSEIRLDMLDGDDTAVISGKVNESIFTRVIGGKGKDTLIDSSEVSGYFLYVTPIPNAETKTIFYDSGKKSKFFMGPSTQLITEKAPFIKPYHEDTDNYNEQFEPQTEDRGHDWQPGAWLNYNSDDGVLIGGGPTLYEFDFRAKPFVYRMSLQAAYATTPQSWNFRYNGEFYQLINGTRIILDMGKSELSFTQFYGFGNETKKNTSLENNKYYWVSQELMHIETKLEIQVNAQFKYWFGYLYRFSQINLKQNTFLDKLKPNGLEDWSYMGISSGLQLDTRNHKTAPTKGFYLDFFNIHFPGFLDNEHAYSKTSADVRIYIDSDFITKSSFAFRLFGEKIWGSYPFFESAFLGGQDNLRGFVRERFAGDAMAFGSVEWRPYLFPFKFVVPAQLGGSLFTETGRVFYAGENSNLWHPSYGGGIWAYFIKPDYMINISVAHSIEKTAFFVSFGYNF